MYYKTSRRELLGLHQLPDDRSRYRALMHLVWTIDNVQRPAVRPHRRQREIIAHPGAAKRLYSPVDHVGDHFRRYDLDHRDLFLRSLLPQVIYHPGRFERQETGLLDLQLRLRNPFLHDTLFDQRFAKSYPLCDALAHHLQRMLCCPDCTHTVVDTSWPQASLGYRKPAAFLTQQVARWHPHILKQHLAVALVIYIAHHRQIALNGHTWCIPWHEHHALLPVLIGCMCIRLAHHNENAAAGTCRPGNPPLASIQNVFVAFSLDQELDIRGIRAGHVRLSHGKSRTRLTIQQG